MRSHYLMVALCLLFQLVFAKTENFMESIVGVYIDYPQSPGNPVSHSFGSGVLVSEDGLIVTNHHVVSGALNITVQTNQGQKALATVIGSAPEFDLSVLKIEPLPGQRFKPITIGKSSEVSIGDPVTAVGNPFGFDQTLTQGVVSHIDRQVGLSQRVQSYIQVDAAINPGNSGGALINQQGELIGIISGIFGPRYNIGLAFAIPSDIGAPVVSQLINKGYATNGWVGMTTQPLTPELKDALEIQNHSGVLISEIVPNSPASRASLNPQDVILKVNDMTINSPQHLASLVTALGSQTVVDLEYLRGHKVHKTHLRTEQLTSHHPSPQLGYWGLNLSEFSRMSLDGNLNKGVEIKQVAYQSSAALSGLQPGDIIKSVNNKPIHDLADIRKNNLQKSNKTHLLEIERNMHTFYVPIR